MSLIPALASTNPRTETRERYTWEDGLFELRREGHWIVEEATVGSQMVNHNTFREVSLYDQGKWRVISPLRWRVLDSEDTIHVPENITAEMAAYVDGEYEYVEGSDEHRKLARFARDLNGLRYARRKAETLRAFEDARLGGSRAKADLLWADSVDRTSREHYRALEDSGLSDAQIQLALRLAETQEELGWTARQLREAIEAII